MGFFNIATPSQDGQRNQTAQAFWSLSADPLAGIDADARFDAGMVGGGLLGPSPQGVDVVIGTNGDAVVRGTVAGVQVNYASAGTPGTARPIAIGLPTSQKGWLLLGLVAFLLLRK